MIKINRDNIYLYLLEKQFNLIDKTIQSALLDKNWREWQITRDQNKEFERFAIPLIRKVFKVNKTKTESIFNWFKENHGLLVK